MSTRWATCRWVLVRCTGNMAHDIHLGDFATREEALVCARAEAAEGPGPFALWLDDGSGRDVHGSYERFEVTP